MAYQRTKSSYDKLNDLSDAWETEDIMEVVDDVKDEIQNAHTLLDCTQDNLQKVYDDFEGCTIEQIKDAIETAIDEIQKSRKELY
jgi:Ni,Fe-hydrogenase maturation factor